MKLLLPYFLRLHAYARYKLYLNIAGMVAAGLLEGAAVILLIPMLTISGILPLPGSNLQLPYLESLRSLPKASALGIILGIYLLIALLHGFINRYLMIHGVEIVQGYSRLLRLETYSALLRAKWVFYLHKRQSDLINLLTIETARVIGGINQLMQLMTYTLFTIVQITIAFLLSPPMTLFVIGCGAVLAIISRSFIRQAKRLGGQTSMLAQRYLSGISDQMNGMKDIKSNQLEGSRMDWHEDMTEGLMKEQLNYIRLRMNSQLFYKISSAVFISLFIFASLQLFHTEGQTLLLIILIFSRLWPTFTSLQSSLEQIASTLPAFEAIQELHKECVSFEEQELSLRSSAGTPQAPQIGIECRNLSFRYSQESDYSLRDVTVSIPSNRMTAIVGRSGAGKSTLIDLIMGLVQPETGSILLDGQTVTEPQLSAYRSAFGYVAQDPFLYNASIRDNLIMVKPNATEAELWEALEFASCAEFVRRLPHKLDTLIGDRGIRLSGGERQRLVLARAIIRKPSILVLDEATSALDSENEQRIQEALERLKGSMTIIVVAHRLSTIRNADQIIVLEQGRCIQQGQYGELSKLRNGMFAKLLKHQEEAV